MLHDSNNNNYYSNTSNSNSNTTKKLDKPDKGCYKSSTCLNYTNNINNNSNSINNNSNNVNNNANIINHKIQNERIQIDAETLNKRGKPVLEFKISNFENPFTLNRLDKKGSTNKSHDLSSGI